MLKPLLALILASAAMPLCAHAADPAPAKTAAATGTIEVQSAWARPSTPNAKMGVAYFMLTNKGSADDTLTGVSTPVADKATLHLSVMQSGISTMRPLASVPVKPGTDVTFAPGGMHVMLEGLKQPLVAGATFPMTLHFEKAGDVATTVTVGQQPADTGMAGMKM